MIRPCPKATAFNDMHFFQFVIAGSGATFRDAKERFHLNEFSDHFALIGYSASAQFVNRFTILHPSCVKAAVIGGCGGYMSPLKKYKNVNLRCPLGIYDYEIITKQKFNFNLYKEIPQFYYMEAQARNDPVSFDDGYGKEDRKITYKLFSERGHLVSRFNNVKNIFVELDCNVTLRQKQQNAQQ